MIATDLNGDGKLDLVVAEADSSTIGVLLGNGDGTFQTEARYAVRAPPLFLEPEILLAMARWISLLA